MPPITPPPCISPPPNTFRFTSGPGPTLDSLPARTPIFTCVPAPTVNSPPGFSCIPPPNVNSPPGSPFTSAHVPYSDQLHWPVVQSPPPSPHHIRSPLQLQNSPFISPSSQATVASLSAPTASPFRTLVTPICQSPSHHSVTSGPSSPWSPWPGSWSPTRPSSLSAGQSGSISSAQSKQTERVDYSSEPTISSLPQSVDLSNTAVQPCLSNKPEGSPIVQFDGKSCLWAQSELLTPSQIIGTKDYQ